MPSTYERNALRRSLSYADGSFIRHARSARRKLALWGLAAVTLVGCGGAISPSAAALVPAPLQLQQFTTMAVSELQSAPSSAGFAAMNVEFSRTTIADDGPQIAEYARRYHIGTIFLWLSTDDAVNLVTRNPQTVINLEALFDVAKVYVVTGDPSWLADPTGVPVTAALIARQIAPMYPRFAGVLYDIDPQAYPMWNSDERRTIAAYFTLLDTLLGGRRPYAFGKTLIATTPNWHRLPNRRGGGSPSMLQEAEAYGALDGTYLVARGGSAQAQMSGDARASLGEMRKPYWLGAETVQHGDSYYGSTAPYLAQNLSEVASLARARNRALAGVSVDQWNNDGRGLWAILAPPPAPPEREPHGPLLPRAGEIYLGAYVAQGDSQPDPQAVAAFEKSIGRTLAYDLHYDSWTDQLAGVPERNDIGNGRIPVVAWDCGDTNAHVAAGLDDAMLRATARQAKGFGAPLFVRFLWEMNLAPKAARRACFDPKNDLPDGRFSPAYFIAAWRHIHDVFRDAGANNVSWVWNESGSGGTPAEYYPGGDAVDWVAVDDYDRNDAPFRDKFVSLLEELAQYGKPIMIAETGANSDYQTQYFPQMSQTLTRQFPALKAVSYFDSHEWTLSGNGVSAFASIGSQPYFSALPF